jgi:integrase
MNGKRAHGEGSWDQLPSGKWRFRMTRNGRRFEGTGETKRQAKDAAQRKAALAGTRASSDTVTEVIAAWVERPAPDLGLRPTTRDQYRYLLAAHITPILGSVRVEQLTQRQVADLFDGMTSSASTRRSTYAALVRVLDFAVGRGIAGTNVARSVPRPREAQAHRPQLNADDASRLLAAAAGHRWEVAAWLSLGCGLRRGEVLGLRWSDVDLDGAVLSVTGNVTRSSAGLVRGEPKTRRGRRQVPIPAVVVDSLRTHRRAQSAERLASVHWVDSGHVITNEVGGIVEPRALSRTWRGWARKAGVKDTGTHAGRHFAAATLLASGRASVADVAAQMGHDPSVLLNVYAVAVADGQRAASDALGAALTRPSRDQSRDQSASTSGGRQ